MTPQAEGRRGASVSFTSRSIQSALVGLRFDEVLLDDPERRSDRTEATQENLELNTSEVQNLLNPEGRVIVLGTPQVGGGQSIYAKWAASGEWSVTMARLFEEFPRKEDDPKPDLHSRWPARWHEDELVAKRRGMPQREWNLHWRIELGTADADAPPIRMDHFRVLKVDPFKSSFPKVVRMTEGRELALEKFPSMAADDRFIGPADVSMELGRYVMTVAAIDPASGTRGNDEVGVGVVSVTTQGLAVVRCIAGVTGRDVKESLNKTAALVHSFMPNKVVVEARAESLFPSQLQAVMARRGYNVLCEPVSSSTPKGERILDAITVPLADQKVVLLETVLTAGDAAETVKQLCGLASTCAA
jgi:hypothetical protein